MRPQEQVAEFKLATGGDCRSYGEMIDLLTYVLYGTALTLGIDLDVAITEVHRANMSKLDWDGKPILRADGKVLKGPDYQAPDMTAAAPVASLPRVHRNN